MKYLSTLSFLLLAISCFGQYDCAQTLRNARTVYDEGRIQALPSLVESCLQSGFSDEEKTEAYRLLVLSYIYLDEPEKADESMLALLRHNPEYAPNLSSDPSELINLYSTFRTRPIFKVGGKIGANLTSVNVMNSGTVNDLNNNANGEYSLNLGFQGGVVFDIPLNAHFSLVSDFLFQRNSFTYESNLFINNDGSVATNNLLIENQNRGELAITVQYKVIDIPIAPYVSAGGAIDYLFNTAVVASREVLNLQEVRENTLDLTEAREKLAYSAVLALGIKPKVKRGNLFIEARIKYGLNNLQKSDVILEANPEYVFDYYGHYNDFTTINYELSVGYVFNIYKPKKLNEE